MPDKTMKIPNFHIFSSPNPVFLNWRSLNTHMKTFRLEAVNKLKSVVFLDVFCIFM